MAYQDISIMLPSKSSAEFIVPKIRYLKSFLENNWKGQFEIVVAINGDEKDVSVCCKLVQENFSQDKKVITHKHYFPLGKGAALQSAFLRTQYDLVAFIDSDLPFDLKFFNQALESINQGNELVTGNRRLPESVFSIPVPVLPFVYKRHLSGLTYNWVLRKIFGLKTKDTQCGIKVMTRNFATQFFNILSCYGFSFDVEMFLMAKAREIPHTSLPVNLIITSEKSTLKLTFEAFRSLWWFSVFKRKQWMGDYLKPKSIEPNLMEKLKFTSDDWGMSEAVNQGILNLAQGGVIKRVSVMANAKFTFFLMDELLKVPGIELGLHFNITNGQLVGENYKYLTTKDGQTYKLGTLLKKTLFGLKVLPQNMLTEIEQEFKKQIDLLKAKGVLLTYFDSHHHIHLLPGVIESVSSVAQSEGLKQTRLVFYGFSFSPKMILHFLSFRAKGQVKKASLNYWPMLYPTGNDYLYNTALRKELNRVKENTEIIVHPAIKGDLHLLPKGYLDDYNGQRVREYWALNNLRQQ